MQVCSLNLEHPCFSHRQLYVVSSRVGKPLDLSVYALKGEIKNMVYEKALNKQYALNEPNRWVWFESIR